MEILLPAELIATAAAATEAEAAAVDDVEVVADDDGCARRSGLDRLELRFSRSRNEDT